VVEDMVRLEVVEHVVHLEVVEDVVHLEVLIRICFSDTPLTVQ